MAQYKEEGTTTITLPTPVSYDSKVSFIQYLRERVFDDSSEQIIIDCCSLSDLTDAQIMLLEEIAELCNVFNTDFLLRPTGIDSKNSVNKSGGKKGRISSATGKSAGQPRTGKYSDFFPPVSSEVKKACLKLDEHLMASKCDPKTHYIVKTVFYEFLNNIILHSEMSPEDYISFMIEINESNVIMTFTDTGMQFDINDQPLGPIVSAVHDEERLSFGINLIRIFSDKIEYTRSEELKNINTIICRRMDK